MRRPLFASLLALALFLPASRASARQEIVPIGVFIGSIEEGARIFTPIRLLPFEHPDSEGHEFPNALRLHEKEVEALVWLGELAGLKLTATLRRYPATPAADWPYAEFREFPVDRLRTIAVRRLPAEDAPIPGLRAAAILDGRMVCFIVDTRGLTLEERGMERATAMGLDLSRADFLSRFPDADGSSSIVLYVD